MDLGVEAEVKIGGIGDQIARGELVKGGPGDSVCEDAGTRHSYTRQ